MKSAPGSGKARRGFASMSKEKQRELASMGGKAAHAKGVGHEWTSEEARAAGRKGGAASGASKTASAKHSAAIADEVQESLGSHMLDRE